MSQPKDLKSDDPIEFVVARFEIESRYIMVVENLAKNYGVANEKLEKIYKDAAHKIGEIWKELDYPTLRYFGKEEAFLSKMEDIFREAENRRLTEEKTLFFKRNVDETTQANRQFKLYLQLPHHHRFHIHLKSKNLSHLDISENDMRVDIHLKPAKKENSKKNPVGVQILRVPHIDESKLEEVLTGFHFTYGDCRCVYKFDSGKEIKINVSTRKEALRVINQLLKLVKPEALKGTAAKNCKFSENSKPHNLTGVRADAIGFHINFPSMADYNRSKDGLRATFGKLKVDDLT